MSQFGEFSVRLALFLQGRFSEKRAATGPNGPTTNCCFACDDRIFAEIRQYQYAMYALTFRKLGRGRIHTHQLNSYF